MPDSNTRAELEHNVGESYAEERDRLDKETIEWRRVVNGLLDNNTEEFKGRLNDRICDEFEWAVDVENALAGEKHIMDLYLLGLLSSFYKAAIMKEAEILASIIVGADHE